MRAYLDTLERIAALARSEPTVLLPSHDPLAGDRLAERITLTDFDFAARNAAELPSRFNEKKLAHLAAQHAPPAHGRFNLRCGENQMRTAGQRGRWC